MEMCDLIQIVHDKFKIRCPWSPPPPPPPPPPKKKKKMDTCDLIYIYLPIMIFMIEVRTSIFFFQSAGTEINFNT